MKNAADEKSAGTTTSVAAAGVRRAGAPSPGANSTGQPNAASMRSRVITRRMRLMHLVSPSRVQPGQQDRRLDLRTGHRRRVVDAVQRRSPRMCSGGNRPRPPRCARPSGQRLDHAPHRPPRQRGIADQYRIERLACQDPAQQAHACSGIAAIDRHARRDAGRAGRRRGRCAVRATAPRFPRPCAQMHAAVARVSSPSRNPSIAELPSASAASMIARWETDLSPGTRSSPRSGPAGALPSSSDSRQRVQQSLVFRACPHADAQALRQALAAASAATITPRSNRRARVAGIGAEDRPARSWSATAGRRRPVRAVARASHSRSSRFQASASRYVRLIAQRRFGGGQCQNVDVERFAQTLENCGHLRSRSRSRCATRPARRPWKTCA